MGWNNEESVRLSKEMENTRKNRIYVAKVRQRCVIIEATKEGMTQAAGSKPAGPAKMFT